MSFGVTRALIRGLIPSLIKEGLSANKALTMLIGQDLHIRRATFLDDWREFKGIAKKSKAWKYTPRKYKIPEDAFVKTAKSIGAERQYIFDVDVRDTMTDDIFQTKFSFTSNRIYTRQEAEELMWNIVDKSQEEVDSGAGIEPVAVWFDVGLIREDARL